jgi:hypothetical protein
MKQDNISGGYRNASGDNRGRLLGSSGVGGERIWVDVEGAGNVDRFDGIKCDVVVSELSGDGGFDF